MWQIILSQWKNGRKVYEVFPGWKKAVKKVASLDDLKKIRQSLRFENQHFIESDKFCRGNLVFRAIRNGDLKLMELFFDTSYDMNSLDVRRGNRNVFMEACSCQSKIPKWCG